MSIDPSQWPEVDAVPELPENMTRVDQVDSTDECDFCQSTESEIDQAAVLSRVRDDRRVYLCRLHFLTFVYDAQQAGVSVETFRVREDGR
jgi:hypothetical protein